MHMVFTMKCLFWISLFLILYTYLVYPLILSLLQKVSPVNIHKKNIFPFVSVIIAAHNEERNISKRLQNLLQQDYPHNLMEIIVSSDGSNDCTVTICANLADQGVIVVDSPENRGKAVALNNGIIKAKGDIIVFADTRQIFRNDAISELIANFADLTVGCVSGELHFLEDPESQIEAEMGAYWRYEKFIRRSESASSSVVGATGCIYAIRRELYQALPAGTILDDVLTPLNIARKGKRVLFEPQAVAYDIISKNAGQEWQRKVRTLAGNWQLLSLAPWIIIPWINPLWWRYVSHKFFRLLVPFGMIVLVVVSLLLPGLFFQTFALIQLAFYGVALSGVLLPVTRSLRFVNLSYFFIVMNAAVVAGFWKWATGGCSKAWKSAYSGKGAVRE